MNNLSIKTVTVIGVTGTMGANVAGIFASFGHAKVYCLGRNLDKVKKTIPRIVKSVKADSIANNLIPVDFSSLELCVSHSDLVFESSAEDMELKKDIAKRVSKVLRPTAVSCTGTSGLSIRILSECYPLHLRGRFFGVHMFNPPYSMTLCEFTRTPYSDSAVVQALKKYLCETLFRVVVDVKDSPAFLGNRIGFQFINETLQYAEKYRDNGGIDYIDAILGPFTGRVMPPLVTSDFVGLDIHKAIVDNIYTNTSDYAHNTFVLPFFVQKLIGDNRLGRKTGGGLYKLIKYDNGLKRQTVLDIETGCYRDQIPYVFPFAEKMKHCIAAGDYAMAFSELVHNHSQEANICLGFLLKYVVYSLYAAEEVGYSIDAADDVMAMGFNWCPPLVMCDALATVVDVFMIIRDRIPEICEKVDVERLLTNIKPSKYDFRPYFRSGK